MNIILIEKILSLVWFNRKIMFLNEENRRGNGNDNEISGAQMSVLRRRCYVLQNTLLEVGMN